jgi:hypothetical protein
MEDESFDDAPFTIRYEYLSGSAPTPGTCTRCDDCVVDGESCANPDGGCGWWGCWQYDQDPPGRYVADLITGAEAAGAVPMITYYLWYTLAGNVEGTDEILALQDGAALTRYVNDWRFLCRTVADTTSGPVILHLEPDLWGYGQQENEDPSQLAVAVSSVGAGECAALPDTFAGFARCLIRIARTESPNALVALHASAWSTNFDVFMNTDGGFDVDGHAARTAAFLGAVSMDGTDLVVIDPSDRDAGYNGRWWDPTNATLPSFSQAIRWSHQVALGMGVPYLWWQVPFGHPGLDDTVEHYRDNRVDYFFDHPAEMSASGALGIAFGRGRGDQTSAESDGGHFVTRAAAYFASGGATFCE